MNILFVHEIDWIAEEASDMHFLAEGLSLLGHKVYAIDCEAVRGKNVFFYLGRLFTKDIAGISRAFDGASVFLRRPGLIRIPGLRKLSSALTHYLEIMRTIREKDIDVIVLYSVTTNGWQTVRLAGKHNIPVVFRFTDIPNTAAANPLVRPLLRFLNKKVYSAAHMLLPNTPRYRKYTEVTGANKSKMKYLPFPIDTTQFRPAADVSEVRKKWDIGDTDAVIVYTGTLLNYSGLDDFIRGFPRILEEVPEARLVIVGKGVQRHKLHRLIIEMHLEEKVILTGFQAYQTVPQYINMAAVCINPYIVNEETIDLFPEKIMRYVACGKPTVATPLEGIKAILPGKTHGVIYARNAEKMIQEVIALLKSPQSREQLGSDGLSKIRKTFSHEKVTGELEQILKDLVEHRGIRVRIKTGK